MIFVFLESIYKGYTIKLDKICIHLWRLFKVYLQYGIVDQKVVTKSPSDQ